MPADRETVTVLPPSEADTASAASLEANLLAAAEALADGTWPAPHLPASSRSACLTELEIIHGVQRAHQAASHEVDPLADGAPRSAESSASLGEAFSRAQPIVERPDLTTARRWGPLFVLEKVGSGSFGEVYRAWDPALDREVALKIVRMRDVDAQASTAVREGQMLAQVRHDNVISVFGAAQIDDEVGIWMEFVRGRTLEQIVREDGPMSAQEATVVAESLCSALAAVHARGLLHRDIKAANVMRAEGGRYVLIDFGTGVEIDETANGVRRMAGTPLYMAPETLRGAAATVQSDVYALGVVLFHVVTGSYPVYGRTLDDVTAAHAAQRRVWLLDVRPGLSAPFVNAVERMLAFESRRRFGSIGECLTAVTTERSPASAAAWMVPIAFALAAAGVAPLLSGLMTTIAYNVSTGREGAFANDRLMAYWYLGFKALVAPTAYVLLWFVGLRAVALFYPIVFGARRTPGSTRTGLIRRVLDAYQGLDAKALADLVLTAQVIALIAAGVGCWSVLSAALTRIATADDLTVFSPLAPGEPLGRHAFRVTFLILLVLMIEGWAAVYRRSAHTNRPHHASIIGGIALIVLTFAVMVLPYRISWQNGAERVQWERNRCYQLGTTDSTILLYCPDLAVPRNRVLPANTPLIRTGRIESIFTPR